MGAMFAIALWEVGVRSKLIILLGISIVLNSPVMLQRFAQMSLMNQWIIVAFLAVYLRFRLEGDRKKFGLWSLVLLALAILYHAYLASMLVSMFTAVVVREIVKEKRHRLEWTAWLAGGALTCFLTMYIAGYFVLTGQGTLGAGGFGEYSMNIFAPFFPAYQGGIIPSIFNLDATGGQYEGLNYFGAGVLLLLLFCGATKWRQILQTASNHKSLTLVLCLMTLYSLSNKIYAANSLLASYPMPEMLLPIVNTFRVAARFFWPMYYAVILIIIVYSARNKNIVAIPVLSIALCVQLFDTYPIRSIFQNEMKIMYSSRGILESFKQIARKHNNVFSLIPNNCSGALPAKIIAPFQFACSIYNVPFNYPWGARLSWPCGYTDYSFVSKMTSQSLLIASEEDYTKLYAFNKHIICANTEGLLLCSNNVDMRGERELFSGTFSKPDLREISLTGEILFNNPGIMRFLANGWFSVEPSGTWTIGNSSTIVLYPDKTVSSVDVVMKAIPFSIGEPLRFSVTVNDKQISEYVWSDFKAQEARFQIPAGQIRGREPLFITLKVENPKVPRELGPWPDDRLLGLHVISLNFLP